MQATCIDLTSGVDISPAPLAGIRHRRPVPSGYTAPIPLPHFPPPQRGGAAAPQPPASTPYQGGAAAAYAANVRSQQGGQPSAAAGAARRAADDEDRDEHAWVCAVCLERMKDGVSSAPCGHTFHDACLRICLKKRKQCPKCRKACQEKQIKRLFV